MTAVLAEQNKNKDLSTSDLAELATRGIPERRVRLQIDRLRQWNPWIEVARSATRGDGVQTLDGFDQTAMIEAADRVAVDGRLSSFVPASGDATRLFERLSRVRAQAFQDITAVRAAADRGSIDAKEAVSIFDQLDRSAIGQALKQRRIDRSSSWQLIIDALAGTDPRSFVQLPKGLIPFHHGDEHERTAVSEHLFDAAALGASRITFTAQDRHTSKFEAEFTRVQGQLQLRFGRSPAVNWMRQDPAFDAVALDEQGALLRDGKEILFRPGGHGVLIHALNATAGDIVTIRNIDNVVHKDHKQRGHQTRKILIGIAASLRGQINQAIRDLRAGANVTDAMAAIGSALDWSHADIKGDEADKRATCLQLLDRPLRICGVIQDLNHKGGGPFWTVKDGRESLQIIEDANLNKSDPHQSRKIEQSTHFNPVDIVAAVRDADGEPYDLARYCDPDAVILTKKTRAGRPISVFEYPGLWNGGMGDWNTLFVEIPAETFNPVKYLSDLLKERHLQAT